MTVDDLIFILANRAYPDSKVTLRSEVTPSERYELDEGDIDIYDDEVVLG